MDAESWKAASKKRNCSFDEVKPLNRYMCVPNVEKTELLELCYDQIRPMVQSGKYLYEQSTAPIPLLPPKGQSSLHCIIHFGENRGRGRLFTYENINLTNKCDANISRLSVIDLLL